MFVWDQMFQYHIQQSNYVFLFHCQISITEHLKQLTDAHRDFGLRHGEYSNTLSHISNARTPTCSHKVLDAVCV